MGEVHEISAFAEMTKALRATQILIDRYKSLQPQQWAGDSPKLNLPCLKHFRAKTEWDLQSLY